MTKLIIVGATTIRQVRVAAVDGRKYSIQIATNTLSLIYKQRQTRLVKILNLLSNMTSLSEKCKQRLL